MYTYGCLWMCYYASCCKYGISSKFGYHSKNRFEIRCKVRSQIKLIFTVFPRPSLDIEKLCQNVIVRFAILEHIVFRYITLNVIDSCQIWSPERAFEDRYDPLVLVFLRLTGANPWPGMCLMTVPIWFSWHDFMQ